MSLVADLTDLEAAADRVQQSLAERPPTVLPPLDMMRTIGSKTAEHYLTNMGVYVRDLIAQAALRPSSRILDIGSGCGRLATAFERYLDETGEYVGLDVWNEGVHWCTNHITAARPHFRFHTVDATNNYYYAKDTGTGNAFDLSFLPSGHFDCVFALSVFTHLRLPDARQYFEHIARVLAPSGHAYLTFFVIDDAFHRYVDRTRNHRMVAPGGGGMWYAYEKQDFFAGFEGPLLRRTFQEFGLEIVRESRGSWAEKPDARLYQDWFLLKRADAGR